MTESISETGRTPSVPPRSPSRQRHHFTVDVEEYFQVAALAPYTPRAGWHAQPARVEIGVQRILKLLSEHQARATFFVLSWVAERAPDLVREIVDQGHEVASHGDDHRPVTTLSRREFRETVASSKARLEDTTGQSVVGYRAPNFSILRGMEWALEILVEEGYRYDSSLFPVRRKRSGFVGGERDPHTLHFDSGVLHEIPPTTLRFVGKTFPAGGGAYFRHLPYSFIRSAFFQAERRGVPGTFYIHPWELDPDQPRLEVPFLTELRHYGGLARTASRLDRFLGTFQFQSILSTLDNAEAPEAIRPSSREGARKG